ncbi:Hypothetical predicted protein [Lecanosticta acicola]|uniref:Uncharacterized protein n=1 Tax=Lecanosticta acicola TaxID=111012 RepID=A0AAI8YZH2_9PEZI|nr:Hypothetical predicted protein [Lecanosticta acicola]
MSPSEVSAKHCLYSTYTAFLEADREDLADEVSALGERIFGQQQWRRFLPSLNHSIPDATREARAVRLTEAKGHLIDCWKSLLAAEWLPEADGVDELGRGFYTDEGWALAVHDSC